MPVADLMLFALAAGRACGEAVAARLGVELSAHEEREFEDGEHKARSLVSVRGRDAYVVQSLHSGAGESVNDRLVRLLFFIGALKDAGAARVTAVTPYLAYARKDRKTKARDPVTTRYVATLFEAVGADCVVTLDVHNLAAFQNAFRCGAENLEAAPLFVDALVPLVGDDPVAVVSPDAGGIKRAEAFRERFARALGRPVGAAFAEKHRSGGVVSRRCAGRRRRGPDGDHRRRPDQRRQHPRARRPRLPGKGCVARARRGDARRVRAGRRHRSRRRRDRAHRRHRHHRAAVASPRRAARAAGPGRHRGPDRAEAIRRLHEGGSLVALQRAPQRICVSACHPRGVRVGEVRGRPAPAPPTSTARAAPRRRGGAARAWPARRRDSCGRTRAASRRCVPGHLGVGREDRCRELRRAEALALEREKSRARRRRRACAARARTPGSR